jgi:hypothetical protein
MTSLGRFSWSSNERDPPKQALYHAFQKIVRVDVDQEWERKRKMYIGYACLMSVAHYRKNRAQPRECVKKSNGTAVKYVPNRNDSAIPGLTRKWIDMDAITMLPPQNATYLYIAFVPASSKVFVPSQQDDSVFVCEGSDAADKVFAALRFNVIQVETELEFATKHVDLLPFMHDEDVIVMAGELQTQFYDDHHTILFNDESGSLSGARSSTFRSTQDTNDLQAANYVYSEPQMKQLMHTFASLKQAYTPKMNELRATGKMPTQDMIDATSPARRGTIYDGANINRLTFWSVDVLFRTIQTFVFGRKHHSPSFRNVWRLQFADEIRMPAYDDAYLDKLCQFPGMRLISYDTEEQCENDPIEEGDDVFNEARQRTIIRNMLQRTNTDEHFDEMRLSLRMDARREKVPYVEDPSLFVKKTDAQIAEETNVYVTKARLKHQQLMAQRKEFCPKGASRA